MEAAAQHQELLAAADELVRAGVMSSTGHVNFSVRLPPDRMLLTSTGLIHRLHEEGLALVGLDGQVHEGKLDTSTARIVGMHTALYQARPDAGAVLHTHSPHLTAFALAAQPLPCRYEPMLRRGQRGPVPVVAWHPRGWEEFDRAIAATAGQHPRTSAVLLANHGIVVFGPSPAATAKLAIVLEEAAASELRATALGGARDLPDEAFDAVAPPTPQ